MWRAVATRAKGRSEMKILVAEDEVVSRRVLTAALPRWGYDVVAACDGREAWERLHEPQAPKLALLDWMMPGMEGPEITRRIRETETSEPPYVILLTARSDQTDIVAGLEAGANDYVCKPFDIDELRARIDVGRRVVELQQSLAHRMQELQDALAHIRHLQGILPICMHCRRIRSDRQTWMEIEAYICRYTDAMFSHGICEQCLAEHYPE